MALTCTAVQEVYDSTPGVFALDGKQVTFPRKFIVTLSEVNPAGRYWAVILGQTFGGATRVPMLGSTLDPSTPYIICQRLSPAHFTGDDGKISLTQFVVLAEYKCPDITAHWPNTEPWRRPLLPATDAFIEQKTRLKDFIHLDASNPIDVLIAGKIPYDNPPLFDTNSKRLTLNYACQLPAFSLINALKLGGTYNQSDVTFQAASISVNGSTGAYDTPSETLVIKANHGKILRIVPTMELWNPANTGSTINAKPYYGLSVEIEYVEPGINLDHSGNDIGLMEEVASFALQQYINADDPQPSDCLDSKGLPVVRPVPITAAGAQAALSVGGPYPFPDQEFRTYQKGKLAFWDALFAGNASPNTPVVS